MSMRKFIDLTEAFDFEPKKYIAQGVANVRGDGLWSNMPMKNLTVTVLPENVFWFDDVDDQGNPQLVGNLNVYFDTEIWNVEKLGLIYTDKLFEEGIRKILKDAGFTHWSNFSYSEQGMQGRDFVNFDVGKELAHELDEKGFIETTKYEDMQ